MPSLRCIPITCVQRQQPSPSDLFTPCGERVCVRGQTLDMQTAALLQGRGLTHLLAVEAESNPVDLDALLHQAARSSEACRIASAHRPQWSEPIGPFEWPATSMLRTWRGVQIRNIAENLEHLQTGQGLDQKAIDAVVDGLLDRLKRHPGPFVELALDLEETEDYLPSHAFTVAVLAMALARQLRWPVEQVRAAGIGALLMDVGMVVLARSIRQHDQRLDSTRAAAMRRHPIFSELLLRDAPWVAQAVRDAAVQHHEREDASGYPLGLNRHQIGDLARVLAVADCFAAATTSRPWRAPKLAYMAMEELQQAAARRRLWQPAVHALIQAVGLFPVGSYVRLSDGKHARVVAANPHAVDRPVVLRLADATHGEGELVDLASLSPEALNVVRPLYSAAG